ncbi:hypothetical protein D3C72_1221530 [compost metagenome]
MKVPAGWACAAAAGAAAWAALAASAACSAGDTSAARGAAVAAGQVPDTGVSARQATGWPAWRSASASTTTTGMTAGLSLR